MTTHTTRATRATGTTRAQGTLTRSTTSGPPLYFYSAAPDGGPGQKALAVAGILHGYGEHAGRYAHVMDAWAERGITSVAIDLRGHGRSGGRRGYCERFDEYLDDVIELERLTREKNLPAFLFGHSLGGLVALSSALARPSPWRAMVLSAPLVGIAMEVPRVKLIAGKIASRFFPTFSLPNGIRSTDVTHDAALAQEYDEDPLVFHIATARWFTEVHLAQERAFARAASLTMPLYVAMGTADRISKYERARAFFDAAGSRDKTWNAREGLFHEVLNEPEWPGIAEKMADWILAHA
jgi:alpha-beta hydrolase superfamily lysophospholipase